MLLNSIHRWMGQFCPMLSPSQPCLLTCKMFPGFHAAGCQTGPWCLLTGSPPPLMMAHPVGCGCYLAKRRWLQQQSPFPQPLWGWEAQLAAQSLEKAERWMKANLSLVWRYCCLCKSFLVISPAGNTQDLKGIQRCSCCGQGLDSSERSCSGLWLPKLTFRSVSDSSFLQAYPSSAAV